MSAGPARPPSRPPPVVTTTDAGMVGVCPDGGHVRERANGRFGSAVRVADALLRIHLRRCDSTRYRTPAPSARRARGSAAAALSSETCVGPTRRVAERVVRVVADERAYRRSPRPILARRRPPPPEHNYPLMPMSSGCVVPDRRWSVAYWRGDGGYDTAAAGGSGVRPAGSGGVRRRVCALARG